MSDETIKVTVFYSEDIEPFLLWFFEETGLTRKKHRTKRAQKKFQRRAFKNYMSQNA